MSACAGRDTTATSTARQRGSSGEGSQGDLRAGDLQRWCAIMVRMKFGKATCPTGVSRHVGAGCEKTVLCGELQSPVHQSQTLVVAQKHRHHEGGSRRRSVNKRWGKGGEDGCVCSNASSAAGGAVVPMGTPVTQTQTQTYQLGEVGEWLNNAPSPPPRRVNASIHGLPLSCTQARMVVRRRRARQQS